MSIKGAYIGIYQTELAAAKAAARALNVNVADLRRSRVSRVQDVVQRFNAIRAFWAFGAYLPPDLEAAIEHRSRSRAGPLSSFPTPRDRTTPRWPASSSQ